jgi:competence ComEA-like helix-hairpin-helix protein
MRTDRHGVALVTAIWMLAVLLVLLAGFAALVHSEMQMARNHGQLIRARWAARAGMARAEATLLEQVQEPATSFGEETALTLSSSDEGAGLENAGYQVTVTDDAARVNVNVAPAETLLVLFPQEVADAIVDWRDADSTPQPEGAEEDYYAGLTPSYRCRNAALLTVGELKLVKGVSDDLLDTALTEGGRPLRDLITVTSWDSNTDAEGETRVNIATANRQTLRQGFGNLLTRQDVDAILRQRSSRPFQSVADLLDVQGLSREKVAQLFDKATVTSDTVRKGLVNLNTAPVEVLAALPGMDEAAAQAIVDYRTNQSPFAGVGQLLEVDGITTTAFKRVANWLTTRSRVFHLTAVGQDADGVQATITGIVQIDTVPGAEGITATTRVLYWKE